MKNVAAVLIALFWVGAHGMKAQTASAGPDGKVREFEVATIKPSDPNDVASRGQMGFNRDEFMTNGQTLMSLIKFAYGLNFGSNDQVVGGPAWLKTAAFDVKAKEDEETVATLKTVPGMQQMKYVQPMVQALLADRFKLKLHHETRTLPVYDLVVAKSGSKLTPWVDPASKPKSDSDKPAQNSWQGLQMHRDGMNRQMEARAATLEMFSNVVTSQPEIGGRMVMNKTGMTGRYDFMLKWTQVAGMGASGANADAGASADTAGPSLFTAMQEQLGLKIESSKAPVDVIVIDSAEMPSDN